MPGEKQAEASKQLCLAGKVCSTISVKCGWILAHYIYTILEPSSYMPDKIDLWVEAFGQGQGVH